MLQTEIADANLTTEQTACFHKILVDIVSENGRIATMETKFIQHLFGNLENVEACDPSSLWRHSDLVLKAAVTVAVLSGRYPIEQARRVSVLAQQFGFSAKRLRILEDQALRAIRYKGKQMNMDITTSITEVQAETEVLESQTGEVSYSDFMHGLWQSDADLIQHTQNSSVDWDDSEDDE